MTLKITDDNSGLVTIHLQSSVENIFRKAHADFLARHGLKLWMLTAHGHKGPSVEFTSNPPDGAEQTTEQITLTLDFGDDLSAFLESQLSAYKLRSKSNP